MKKNIFNTKRETLSVRSYNACIGLSLLFGFVITTIATYIFENYIGCTFNVHPIILSIIYLVVSLGASHMSVSSDNNSVILLGYIIITLATAALLSSCITYERINILLNLATTTGIVLVVMIIVVMVCPSAFLGLKHILITVLIAFISAELFMIILLRTIPAFYELSVIGIFSFYIGCSWSKGQEYPKTGKHVIISVIDLYLPFNKLSNPRRLRK